MAVGSVGGLVVFTAFFVGAALAATPASRTGSAVGSIAGPGQHPANVKVQLDGPTGIASGAPQWRIMKGPGGFAVSCVAALKCFVVGGQYGSTNAYLWNGYFWKSTPMPPLGNIVANGGTANPVGSVSCVSFSFCMGQNGDVWNGKRWSETQDPFRGTYATGSPSAVSRPALNECLMVGSRPATGFVSATWNGSRWSSGSLPALPAPSLDTQVVSGFQPLSCSSMAACAVVGPIDAGLGVPVFADIWDGHVWTASALPVQTGERILGLTGVSCPTKNDCTVVGNQVTAGPPATVTVTVGNNPSVSGSGPTGSAYVAQWNGRQR